MYADPAGIFLSENPIFQKKNAVLADFAAGLSLIIKQNLSGGCLEGGPVPLRPLLRSRRLSCNSQCEKDLGWVVYGVVGYFVAHHFQPWRYPGVDSLRISPTLFFP